MSKKDGQEAGGGEEEIRRAGDLKQDWTWQDPHPDPCGWGDKGLKGLQRLEKGRCFCGEMLSLFGH